jgi:hypothetical protein
MGALQGRPGAGGKPSGEGDRKSRRAIASFSPGAHQILCPSPADEGSARLQRLRGHPPWGKARDRAGQGE